jgi:hypothetical protein
MSAQGSLSFSLTLEMRVINVTPGDASDTMTMQSFLSESANEWHMLFD